MTTLAITGATGHVGGRAARLLGPAVTRLLVRDPARAPRVDGEPDVAAVSYDDREGALAALDGIDVLLMVSGADTEHRRAEARRFIGAAADAGVRHIVYTSFEGAAEDAVFSLARDDWDAEQAIRESGMAFTFLHDNFYSDFFLMCADAEGRIRGPGGDGRAAAVARSDVGDVAAAVLADPVNHEGAVYSLTGPEALSFAEAAERLATALGRRFSYVEETVAEAYESRRALTDEQWQLESWVSTYRAIADGTLARVTGDVPRLTGHAARTMEEALASA